MSDIAWQPWGEAAFAQAAAQERPVLLSISAVWCHWCHVMDRTTYADPDVAAAIGDGFVPVRVDNDERPDVNARYNMGGWPTTAFLTPDGSILTGATYLPAHAMLRALEEISTFYRNEKAAIAERAEQTRAPQVAYTLAGANALATDLLDRYAADVLSDYDDEYAGFGDAPKFPQPELLEYLLARWRSGGERKAYDAVAQTMLAMTGGGMYDHVEGGFFRYSTTRDWSVPHFEKMAEDHAGLLRVLAQLEIWTPAPQWRDALARTLGYVRRVMRDPSTGLFAGSQDADEAYYAADAAGRAGRQQPFVDRRSYTNWSAALAGAFAWCGVALDDGALVEEAVQALDTAHARLRDAGGLLFHVLQPGESPRVAGLLGDQTAYIRALLDTYEATGKPRFLERARSHTDASVAAFGATDGGFVDRLARDQIGRLEHPDRPLVENGLMAENLLRLGVLAGEPGYRAPAERTLRLYAKTFERARSFAATYARALERYLAAEVVVRVAGVPERTAAFRAAARRLPTPFACTATESGAEPAAYVCVGTVCAAPAADPAEVSAAYESIA